MILVEWRIIYAPPLTFEARLSYLWEYKRKREKFPKRKGEKRGKGEFPKIY
jgi:hypothetical protein